MNLLITICARGGSKGAKGKNIRNFFGKPLIDYTLILADLFRKEYKLEYTTDIVISSDSDEILERADYYNDILSVKRPNDLSLDSSPKVPAIQHAVAECERLLGKKYDFIVDLDVTSPLRHTKNVYDALQKLVAPDLDLDLVFSAVPARRNPYFNMVELIDGYAYKIKESTYASRQEAPDAYDMNASIYCYKRDALINKLKRITFEGNSGLIEMPETYVIDIDHEQDFAILELLVKYYYYDMFSELFD